MLYNNEINKNLEEIIEESIDRLSDKSPLTNFSEGSVARSLLEVMGEEMNIHYDYLDYSTAMSYISSAEGAYLDEIAKLFDMERLEDESDENFRYRIQKAQKSLAKANETAIRLAVLSTEGVNDVLLKPFVRGSGSYDAFIIPETEVEMSAELLSEVQSILDEVSAKGIDAKAVGPEEIYVDMDIRLVFFSDTTTEVKHRLISEVEEEIRSYIINLELGENLVIKKVIANTLADRDALSDIIFEKMRIDGKEVVIKNQELYWDQRFIPQEINVN